MQREPSTSGATDKTVFLVGVPRSGTTWTMTLLEQHPRVAALQQSGLVHQLQPLRRWWQSTGGYGKRLVAHSRATTDDGVEGSLFVGQLLEPENLNAHCGAILRDVYDRLRRASGNASVIVDQTPENLEFADWIHEVLPEARFLHVVRDPRAVYASMRAANAAWAKGEFPRYPESVGSMWASYMQMIRDLKQKTGHVKEVRYEDLIDDGYAQLSSIYSWLDLDFDASLVRQAVENCHIDKMRQTSIGPKSFLRKGAAKDWRSEVSRLQSACVEYHAHTFMATYGYPLTGAGAKRQPLPARIRADRRKILDPVFRALRPGISWAKRLVGQE